MSTTELLLLGAIAGLTIFLGLPVGRIRRPMPRTRAALNAGAIGILVFLLFDVLAHANEPVEAALTAAHDGTDSWARFVGMAAVFAGGVGVGLLSLVYYDRWLGKRTRFGPGAAATTELRRSVIPATWTAAHRLAFFIALGIGLHNFSEGLAIGQAAASDEISLAGVLIIGFALHNATEGFGIVAPFASEDARPSWAFLLGDGSHRWRPDVPRHDRGQLVRQRGTLRCVPRPRRWFDPLCHRPVAEGQHSGWATPRC